MAKSGGLKIAPAEQGKEGTPCQVLCTSGTPCPDLCTSASDNSVSDNETCC